MTHVKLDILRTAREAYGGAWSHAGEMLRLIWLPGLLYLSLSFIGAPLVLALGLWVVLVLYLAALFLWSIIAVAWHRFILIGDMPPGRFHLHFGRRESRFAMVSILLGLLLLPGFLLMATGVVAYLGQADLPGVLTFLVIGLILLCIGTFFFVRLALLLPAVAVDDPINARLMLELTRGNFWRLTAALACVFLPISLFQILAGRLVYLMPSLTVAVNLMGTLINIFFAIVNVAVLSIAYRELIGPAGTQAPDTEP